MCKNTQRNMFSSKTSELALFENAIFLIIRTIEKSRVKPRQSWNRGNLSTK